MLRPFRRRLYRQRIVVGVLRLLALAALVAAIVLLLRVLGLAVPLPATPVVCGGIVLFAGLSLLLRQSPSAPQLAHALDERLRLHEQVASALEFEHDGADNTTGLRRRALHAAATVAHSTPPDTILEWPSVRREGYALGTLVIAAGIIALVAAHAPARRPASTTMAARSVMPPHNTASRQALHAWTAAAPMKILPLKPNSIKTRSGSAARTGHSQAAPPGSHPQAGRSGADGTPRLVAGKSSTGVRGTGTHAGRGAGGQQTTAGTRGATGTQGTPGSASGQSASLHLSSGKNSTAGGVESPQQRALQDLRNSIQATQAQANRGQQPGNSTGNNGQAPNGAQSGQQGSNQAGRTNASGRNGKNGAGRKRGSGSQNGQRGAQGQNGQRGSANASAQGQSSSPSNTRGAGSQQYGNAYGPEEEYGTRYGHPGSGTGSDSGAPNDSQTTTRGARATLGNDSSVTLNGAPNGGGHLVFSIGAVNRAAGSGSSPFSGGSANQPSTPGYVAPDSNAITPGDRSVVQGYFTPSSQ